MKSCRSRMEVMAKHTGLWGHGISDNRNFRSMQVTTNQNIEGELKPGETLDTLYERFNIHRPDDFTGHSLSVSDVIVLESEGKEKHHFMWILLDFRNWKISLRKGLCEPKQKKNNIRFPGENTKILSPGRWEKAEEIENNVREYLHKKCESRVCRYNSVKCCCMEARSQGTEKADF